MKVLGYMVFVILHSGFTLAREEWVDPHDLKIKLKSTKQNTQSVENKIEQCSRFNLESRYLKSFVQNIVDAVKFDQNLNMYKGHVALEIDQNDYNFLKEYILSSESDYRTLEKLKTILKNSFEKSSYDIIISSVREFIYFNLCNERTLLAVALSAVVYMLWKMQPHKYEFKTLVKIFFPLVYVADFILRYNALLEEEEVNNYLEQKSFEKCDINNLSFTNQIYNFFTGYCHQKEKTFLLSKRSAYHLITPMRVISEQFDVLVPILKHLGRGMGYFMTALLDDTPWYMKALMIIPAFVLTAIILLMIGCCVLNVSPKLKILNVFHLEFTHKDQTQDSIFRENLNAYLEDKKVRKQKKSQRNLKNCENVQKKSTENTSIKRESTDKEELKSIESTSITHETTDKKIESDSYEKVEEIKHKTLPDIKIDETKS